MYSQRDKHAVDAVGGVDLRSDTVTRPSKAMREMMANAEVGDDVMHEDQTVKELEARMAMLIGKEAGLFVTSGTMGNLLASMVHCKERSSEAIVGDKNHIFLYEQGSLAHIAGVQASAVPMEKDGTFSLQGIKDRIRNHNDDHYPKTAMIAVENTQNYYGGLALPLEWIDEVTKIGKDHGIPTHLDGARLFHASVASGVPPKRLAHGFSSVTVCLSKGLGAPCGSILMGDADFIRQARRFRKAIGGGMRQVGVLAAAGLYCLDHMISRIDEDHKNAKLIANAIDTLKSPVIEVDTSKVQTNMVLVQVNPKIPADEVCKRFLAVSEEEKNDIGDEVKVLAWPRTENKIRMVLHCDITNDMAKKAAAKICYVAKDLSRMYGL